MSHNNTNTAQRNLEQAAQIETSSAWSVARLIAASVEPGRAGDNQHGGVALGRHLKLGMREASRVMGRSDNTIRAYLNAWNAAAADGLCAPSSDLTPEDGWTADMPEPMEWEKYKNPNSHSGPRKTETVPAEPAKAAAQWTPTQRQEVVRDLIANDPEVAAVARQSVERTVPPASEEMKARIAHSREVREADEKSMTGLQKSLTIIKLNAAADSIADAKREAAGTTFSDEERDAIAQSVEDVRRALIAFEVEAFGVDWDAALVKLSGGEK